MRVPTEKQYGRLLALGSGSAGLAWTKRMGGHRLVITDKEKLLALLRNRGAAGVHTSELRRMGVSGNPSQRRLDLLADGYEIRSERESYRGADGKTRPGARFTLIDGPALGAGASHTATTATEADEPASVEREAEPEGPGDPEPRLFDTVDLDIPKPAPSAAVDLFAGPGGWDYGARELGLDPLGIEFDDAACATREAAGLRTEQADVAALDPTDYAPCDLLIASPPCQAWSMAGKREGQLDIERVYALTAAIAAGEPGADEEWADPRSRLVTEPLRWALALRPRLIAWEQVPPVLDYWKHCAEILRAEGYHVWTGILSAERYGVPQTRKRAILLASLDGHVHPPLPTHQEYRAGEPAWTEPMLSLEGELQPWVSMAEALGWGMNARPYPAIACSRDTGGPDYEKGIVKRAGGTVAEAEAKQDRLDNGCGDPKGLKGDDWPERRPATVLAGDPRVFQPGGHHGKGEQSQNAVRVSIEEASILQSFPPDYPWQGSRSKRFQQIGNAVPPLMARAVLSALLEAQEARRAA